MTSQNNITTFIKVILLTTVLFGGLVAQSYATNLMTETFLKMNVKVSQGDDVNEVASVRAHDKQSSSFEFGNHQIDVKTTFVNWADATTELEKQILAEIQVRELDDAGKFELKYSPSVLILRNKWAELEIGSETDEATKFKLKLQYEDLFTSEESASLFNSNNQIPAWLYKTSHSEIDLPNC